MPLELGPRAVVIVPDERTIEQALADATDLAVVAHPDDLELLLPTVLASCSSQPDRSFVGVVCTDGAGSIGVEGAPTGSTLLVALRADEQRAACEVGGHAVVMLGCDSTALRDPGRRGEVARVVADILRTCEPAVVYTHALLDRHVTHVAVALAVVDAARRAGRAGTDTTSGGRDSASRGRQPPLLGVEGWCSLDWLADDDRVELPGIDDARLGRRLAACFGSQLAHKRYDVAMEGRRRANATLHRHDAPDAADELTLALDMTQLVVDPGLEPSAFLDAVLHRATAVAAGRLTDLQ